MSAALQPDMNPVEKAYSKLKAYQRQFAEQTVAALMRALDACAKIFKPAECENTNMLIGVRSKCPRDVCEYSGRSSPPVR